jgi:hypothetical protein
MKQVMRLLMLCSFIACGAVAGCDDTPEVPQAVLDEASKPDEEVDTKRPTTQELLSGRRTRSQLAPLPLTMEIPPSWTQGTFEGVENPGNLLQGYTPNGVVQISLGSKPSIKPERLDQIVTGAKKEMEKNPNLKAELKTRSDLKVLELQKVLPPKEFPTYSISGNQMVTHTSIESPFNWTMTVFVPHEGGYQVYDLNFIGLTKSQYDKDKEFLESILSTIQYGSGSGAATDSPPPTTAP